MVYLSCAGLLGAGGNGGSSSLRLARRSLCGGLAADGSADSVVVEVAGGGVLCTRVRGVYNGMSILIGGCLVVVYCPCDSGGTEVCCGMVVADSVVVEVVADSVVVEVAGGGVLCTRVRGVYSGMSILIGGCLVLVYCPCDFGGTDVCCMVVADSVVVMEVVADSVVVVEVVAESVVELAAGRGVLGTSSFLVAIGTSIPCSSVNS